MKFPCRILVIFCTVLPSILAEKYLWFTAVGNGQETDYLMMIQAAVESGLQCCSETLYPVVIVGGDPAYIPSWLTDLHASKNVLLLNHNLSFSSRIEKFGTDKSIRQHGAFQRLDIPLLVGDLQSQLQDESIYVSGEFVMYTDADVLMYNVKDFIKPHMIAYGAEDEKGQAANSGVLFMNVANMKKEIEHLFDFADKGLWNFPAIEQGLVLQYFRGKHQQISDLYNWKPYWGVNTSAQIVHFHGAKVDRCVECFIKHMYTTNQYDLYPCATSRGSCGAFALWNAVARARYKLTYKQQMQSYIHYVREVYRFIYELSTRLDGIKSEWGQGQQAPQRRVFTIASKKPRLAPDTVPTTQVSLQQQQPPVDENREHELIKELYFKQHPPEN